MSTPTPVPSEVAETTAGEREVEALAEVFRHVGSPTRETLAHAVLASDWLAAHDDRVRREEGAKVLREAAEAARCGGCKGQGAHRRHCPRHPSYHPWIPLADRAESIGDSIGVPELANRAWQLAGAIRAEMPMHPYRAASVGRGEGL